MQSGKLFAAKRVLENPAVVFAPGDWRLMPEASVAVALILREPHTHRQYWQTPPPVVLRLQLRLPSHRPDLGLWVSFTDHVMDLQTVMDDLSPTDQAFGNRSWREVSSDLVLDRILATDISGRLRVQITDHDEHLRHGFNLHATLAGFRTRFVWLGSAQVALGDLMGYLFVPLR